MRGTRRRANCSNVSARLLHEDNLISHTQHSAWRYRSVPVLAAWLFVATASAGATGRLFSGTQRHGTNRNHRMTGEFHAARSDQIVATYQLGKDAKQNKERKSA